MAEVPSYDVDFYAEGVIADPYPHYSAMRALGPLVWLPQNGLYAITRYAEVKQALSDHHILISGQGVAGNAKANALATANLLASDPPLHDHLRKVVGAPVMPDRLAAMRPRIMASAEALIDRLLVREGFDGMSDLAHYLPVSIVSELVGLPEAGRENMLRWAAATFDMLGGKNARLDEALPIVMEMRAYCEHQATRENVREGGWVAMLYDAAEAGLIEAQKVPVLMRDYLGPALDTTIFATGHLLHQLGQSPDQWQILRESPNLIPNAINEAIRHESPIRAFTRVAAEDYQVGDHILPKGARVLVLYASANRDERQWDNPEVFDIRIVPPMPIWALATACTPVWACSWRGLKFGRS